LLGANDYVMKPANVASLASGVDRVRNELISKIKAYCATSGGSPVSPGHSFVQAADAGPLSREHKSGLSRPRVDIVAIGVSTGGPNALAELLPSFPGDFPVPILIVQHMPPIFTKLLAERLASKSCLPVDEAESDQTIVPRHAWLAPGNFHMIVQKNSGAVRIRTHQGPPENSCRPSVDVLFRSVAEVYGSHVLAVVMTGMGQDGLRGCKCVDEAGGHVLVQDEASSVVWGMPGFVAQAGLADRVLPLDQLGAEILHRIRDHRDSRSSTPLRAAGPNTTAGQSWR
jgi:two-component system, chemotaxis family, protein-glutamate methylesterase/glutaminase